ncbi:MAG TPA: preprotein translocase subunit YajC [Acidimicrobiales bacterium]|nr:preprotein translocase subunit YajC [Acidimicrobiales bacterium]
MHALLTLLAQSTTPTTAAKSTRSSGSYVPLLIIIGVFAVVYFGFLRPRQQRLRQQQTAARELGIGDEVVSAGGIYGRVVALDANEVEVEVAPGVVLTFLRRAISPRTQGGPAGGAGRGFGGAPTRGSQPVDEPGAVVDGVSRGEVVDEVDGRVVVVVLAGGAYAGIWQYTGRKNSWAVVSSSASAAWAFLAPGTLITTVWPWTVTWELL